MFTTEASFLLTVANSAYSKNSYFTLDEWFQARDLRYSREDLAKRDRENKRKSATNFGVT